MTNTKTPIVLIDKEALEMALKEKDNFITLAMIGLVEEAIKKIEQDNLKEAFSDGTGKLGGTK